MNRCFKRYHSSFTRRTGEEKKDGLREPVGITSVPAKHHVRQVLQGEILRHNLRKALDHGEILLPE